MSFHKLKSTELSRYNMIIMDIVHYIFDELHVLGFGFSV
jgi:hypothetical protein